MEQTKTQCETMLEFIQTNPTRIWFAKDFQHAPYFVGYESIARLCDLVNKGLIEKVGMFDKDGMPGGKYAGYRYVSDPFHHIPKEKKKRPTTRELLMQGFIAGRKTVMDPKIGMFASPEELADEYVASLEDVRA